MEITERIKESIDAGNFGCGINAGSVAGNVNTFMGGVLEECCEDNDPFVHDAY